MSKIIYTEEDFEKFQGMIKLAEEIGYIYYKNDPCYKRGTLENTRIDYIDSMSCSIVNTEHASGCGYEDGYYTFSTELFNKNHDECKKIIVKEITEKRQKIENEKRLKELRENTHKEEIAKAKRAELISSLTPEEIDEITSNLQQK